MRAKPRWISFYWDKPEESGCRGFALRLGRATFSFTWKTALANACEDG